MQFTPTDFQQTEQVADIIRFCDTADNQTLESIMDQVYRYQPFLLSLFLGYKDEVDIYQLDEVLRILLIIWLFFQDHPGVKHIQITAKMFEDRERKNISFLKYLEGEPAQNTTDQLTDNNLGALKSKALFTAALFKVKQGKAMKRLPAEKAGIILLGMKSLIECFENLGKHQKQSRLRR